MKNKVLTLVVACLSASHVQAAIDNSSSLIVAPRSGAVVGTSRPVIAGVVRNANQNPVKNKPVTIYVDNRIVATVPTNKHGVWSYALSNAQELADGCHCVQACVAQTPLVVSWLKGALFVVDATRASQALRSGTVSAANSTINFPPDGAYVNTTTPIIVGTLLDSSFQPVDGETVQVKIDSTTVGSPVSDSNGVFSYQLMSALTENTHVVDAHCVQSSVDLATNSFVVDVTPPAAPAIDAPTQNSTVTSNPVVVSGTTEPLATITTFMDGDTYGDITYADASGNWSNEYSLSNATHSFTAQATDLAGNQGSVSSARTFSVNA